MAARGRLVDIAAPRRGSRLDAGRGVHPVADDEALLGRLGRGRATGHDPDAGLELGPVLGAVGGDGRDELEAGSHRTLGVVLLRDRGSPDRHDGVADELLHDAAVAADDRPGELEVAREDLPYLLGVPFLREGREADEVAEQHRDVAELGGGRGDLLRWLRPSVPALAAAAEDHRSSDRRPAVTAESLARLELRPTRGADGSQRSAAVPTEPFAVRVLASTRWAAHHPSSCPQRLRPRGWTCTSLCRRNSAVAEPPSA